MVDLLSLVGGEGELLLSLEEFLQNFPGFAELVPAPQRGGGTISYNYSAHTIRQCCQFPTKLTFCGFFITKRKKEKKSYF